MEPQVVNSNLKQLSFLHHLCRRFFMPVLFLCFCGSVFAQDAPVDSTKAAQDSINKKQLQQAKENAAATGQDTTRFVQLSPDSSHSDLLGTDTIDHVHDSIMAVKKAKRHSPKKAALLSLALPGLGQAYNKKYWKIPIIYAGFGGLGYAIYYTGTNFYGYRNAYRGQLRNDPNASYKGVDNAATLKSYRDYFKNNFDISVICTGLWYFLNIIDATVDAHLFEWNMKDDLNVSWRPAMLNENAYSNAMAPGASVRLTFK